MHLRPHTPGSAAPMPLHRNTRREPLGLPLTPAGRPVGMSVLQALALAAAGLGTLASNIAVLDGRGVQSWLSPHEVRAGGRGHYSMLSLLSGQANQRWIRHVFTIPGKKSMAAHFAVNASNGVSGAAAEHIRDISDSSICTHLGSADKRLCAALVLAKARQVAKTHLRGDNEGPDQRPETVSIPRVGGAAGDPPAHPRCMLAAQRHWEPEAIAASSAGRAALLQLAGPAPEAVEPTRRDAEVRACPLPDGSDSFRARLGIVAFSSHDGARLGYVTNTLRRFASDTRAGGVAAPSGCKRWSLSVDVHVGIGGSESGDSLHCSGAPCPFDRCASSADASWPQHGRQFLRRYPARSAVRTKFRVAAGLAEGCPGDLLADLDAALPPTAGAWPTALRAAIADWRVATRGTAVRVRVWSHAAELTLRFEWSARERTLLEAEAAPRRPHVAGIFEDDFVVTADTIRAHWEWSAFMPADWTPGMLQVEEDWRQGPAATGPAGRQAHLPTRSIISGTPVQSGYLSLYVHRRAVFAVFENSQQGGFLLETERRWPKQRGSRGCLSRREEMHWFYQPIESAATGPFFQCGLTRAVPLPMAEDARTGQLRVVRPGDESWPLWASYDARKASGAATVLAAWRSRWQVHHAPNKYLFLEEAALCGGFPVSDEHLVAWASMCA